MITLYKFLVRILSKAITSQEHIRLSSTRPLPSNDAHAVLLELKGTHILSSILSGNNIGRNESVCGQMGVINIAGISGCTSEPPADNYHASQKGVQGRRGDWWLVTAADKDIFQGRKEI